MHKLSVDLELDWDRCILHLLHLKVHNFLILSKERLQKIHAIATMLHSTTCWNE